ncbi:MAG: universal stress protein, partial [Anaerolineales bacterium]|nr:universal stress protein [Anaerolineales bacterium]
MFERILLAVDGSDHAVHAAKVAGNLARSMEAELRIVTVYEPIPALLGEPYMQVAVNARLDVTQVVLQNAVIAVGDIPNEIQTAMIEGNPAETIIEVAQIRKSDLIVMGSRGLGRLAGMLLGSTSQKVVSHAPCPV